MQPMTFSPPLAQQQANKFVEQHQLTLVDKPQGIPILIHFYITRTAEKDTWLDEHVPGHHEVFMNTYTSNIQSFEGGKVYMEAKTIDGEECISIFPADLNEKVNLAMRAHFAEKNIDPVIFMRLCGLPEVLNLS